MRDVSDLHTISVAADVISQRAGRLPAVGVVLGSGLGDLAQSITDAVSIPYEQIPFFAPATVEGHRGELVIGRLGSRDIALMNGRLHYYEGYSLQQVTFPIRVLKQIGCNTLIITNAAGGLNPAFNVGDLMLITDHINLPGFAGNSPLFGPNNPALGGRFPDMHNAYDRDLRRLATDAANHLGFALREGIYAMLGGPAFETPAEVRFLRSIGADAVGMSTAAEVIVARHGGQRVLGISMISNVLSADPDAPVVNHEEVLAAGTAAIERLAPLIMNVISRL